jgi:hypothetical protein
MVANPYDWFMALDTVAKATWIIAVATVVNVFVYARMSIQTKRQIKQTEKQLDFLLELNRPRVSAWIDFWGHEPGDERMHVMIKIRNFGNMTAQKVSLLFSIKGLVGDFSDRFAEFVLEPQDTRTETSIVPLAPSVYAQNDSMKSFIDCAYQGIDQRPHAYRQNYRYDCKRNAFIGEHSRSD